MIMLTQVFTVPQENMDFDQHLLLQHAAEAEIGTQYLRLYRWPATPAVTYCAKQMLPVALQSCTQATRLTGGGIVFHSPGDLLISLVGHLQNPALPAGLHSKAEWFSAQVATALGQTGITVATKMAETASQIQFCQTYHNPFELYHQNAKIFGLSMRKFRQSFLIQSILHVTPAAVFFPNLASPYCTYLASGLSLSEQQSKDLLSNLSLVWG